MSEEPAPKQRVAIIGGGIGGLTAAEKLADQGYEVVIYDSNPNLGGKIDTIQRGDWTSDAAAEFIDTDQKSLRALAEKVGVEVIPSQDRITSTYYMPNGKVLSEEEFNQAYLPISTQVMQDKALLADTDPKNKAAREALAQKLDSMSMTDYVKQLAANVKDERPWWKKIFSFWNKAPIDPDIATMAAQAYTSERGVPSSKMSALQYVYESGSVDAFIHSDAAFRVKGGTKNLIDALQADLAKKGVTFHTDTKTTGIKKQDGKFNLDFDKAPEGSSSFDQVVFATQAHNLANINGLQARGLSSNDVDTLKNVQYTHNTKITIRTNAPPAKDGFFWSNMGYQTWTRPGENSLVFLIGDDLSNKYSPQELLKIVTEDYARAHNLNPDSFFDKSQIDFRKPDDNRPCYPAPKPGDTQALQRLSQSFDNLAQNGIGFAGTYVIKPEGGAVGYMGDAVESAERASEIMINAQQARQQALGIGMQPASFVDRYASPPTVSTGRGR